MESITPTPVNLFDPAQEAKTIGNLRLHEVSRFKKVDGAWVYMNGELKPR